MDVVLGQLINGLSLGSILLLVALGLNITFGMMGIINFAHGEFMILGAYCTYIFQKAFLPVLGDLSYFLSIPLAFLVVAGFGFLIERIMIRHLYNNAFGSILATWGLSLIMMQSFRLIFGHNNVQVSTPEILKNGIILSPDIQIPMNRAFIFLLCIIIIVITYIILNRSKIGKQIQAVMQNRNMAGCMGIRTHKMDSFTFALGSGIAGIAGVALTLIGPVGPEAGQNYIVDAFMVVCLGGLGGMGGSIAGASVIGIANPYIEYFTSASLGKVLIFAMIIIFLHFKPSGLVKRKTRALED